MCVGPHDLSDVRGTSPPKDIGGWAKSFKNLEAHVIQWGFVWQMGHKASQNLGGKFSKGHPMGSTGHTASIYSGIQDLQYVLLLRWPAGLRGTMPFKI